MTAAEVASALGSNRRSGQWWRCICPVHGSRTGNSLTLALRQGERGLVVHCHAGCSRDEILAELRKRGLTSAPSDYARSMSRLRPPRGRDGKAGAAHRIAAAHRIWDAAQDARRSPVVRYLAGRRITVGLPPSLRWAPTCPHPSGIYLPAMVARVDNIDGELIGVHRTYLQPNGSGKANVEPAKAILGLIGGGAARLALAAETLMIAEGIETALAAVQATAMPAWAALSTSGLEALVLPPIVRRVIILADHDRNGAGERAARIAAQRWGAERRRVLIAMPPEPGTDFADVLVGRAYARIAEVRDVAA